MGLRALLGLLCAAVLATTQPATAQKDPLAEALALPFTSGLTGARDVPRFAWVENAAGVRNVWIADAGKPARQVTVYAEDDGVPLYDVNLSPDGRRIAYVRGGDDEFPDGSPPNAGSAAFAPAQQLYLIDGEGARAGEIGEGHSPRFAPNDGRIAFTRRGEIWLWNSSTGAKKIAAVTGQVTRLQWSPDGRRLLFVDNRDDHAFVALLDLPTARLTYLDPGLDYSVEPIFSPDGTQVAFIRYRDPPMGAALDSGPYWSIRIADVASGKSRTLWTAPPGRGAKYYGTRSRNLWWSKDDNEIIFPWERSGFVHAWAIDAARGGTPRDLTPGAFEVESYILDPSQNLLLFAANREETDRRHIWVADPDGGDPIPSTQSDGIESLPVFAADTLAVMATSAAHPVHPATVRDGKLTPLGKAPALASFVTPEAVKFRAADGVEVHAQLFRAKGPGRHPAIVYIHGGPRRQMLLGFHPYYYYSNAYVLNQHLAARGYDVLSINYRSGTGYGRDFRDAPEIGRGGASEYRDVLAAGQWLAKQSHVDPTKIGIWGGSWGGYLTALALARNSDLFASGVDLHGVHAMVRTVDNNLSPEAQAKARQLAWNSSPMGAIERWRSPVLLIHGDDDRNVDFDQSLLLARELAARRIPFEELVFPNERHDFMRFAHWLESYRATEAFFEKTLKGKP